MKRNKFNKGISLLYLIIVIIITFILASTATLAIKNNVNKSKLINFVNDLFSLEDGLRTYYIQYDTLPSSGNELKKDDLSSYQSDTELYNEITKNGDDTSSFYILDVNKIKASVNEDDAKNYVFSYPNFNVYYLKGKKVNKIKYYSITDKINENILKEVETEVDNSAIIINNGAEFKVTYDGANFKNTLDIKLEYDTDKYTLDISVMDSSNNIKTFFKTNGEKIFTNATDIDSELSSIGIEKITFELKNSENEVVAKETINTSNYDPFVPKIANITGRAYTDMSIITFDAIDEGKSGISKVRYEYVEGLMALKEKEYMETKSKVINTDNISDGKVSIKVPKDVKGMEIIAIDKAGNISDIYYTPVP